MAKTYDPKKVSVIVGGHIVEGYADGTFVGVARNNDAWTRTGGADGEQTRAKSNDKSGTVTLTLMQSSLSNAILSGFTTADELNNGGTFPLLVKDSNGSEVHAAEIAWVQKRSDSGFGKENENREWVIETGELNMIGGGIS